MEKRDDRVSGAMAKRLRCHQTKAKRQRPDSRHIVLGLKCDRLSALQAVRRSEMVSVDPDDGDSERYPRDNGVDYEVT